MSLFELFAAQMTETKVMAQTAAKQVATQHGGDAVFLRKNFSALLQNTEELGYELYLKEEQRIGETVIGHFLKTNKGKPVFGELNSFFLSLSQSRRSRAGTAFEETIKGLFRQCGYPFEEQCVVNGIPDFLMPSKEYYLRNAPDCIIFTAKRTLRERWRQIATEGVRGKALFLATLDDNVSSNAAAEMLTNRIYLVVPKTLKESNRDYLTTVNIISFEDFFTDHLDPAMVRWRRAHVI